MKKYTKLFCLLSLFAGSYVIPDTPAELLPQELLKTIRSEAAIEDSSETAYSFLLENDVYINNLRTVSTLTLIYSILGSIRKFYYEGEPSEQQNTLSEDEQSIYISLISSTYHFLPAKYIAQISVITDQAGLKELEIKRSELPIEEEVMELNKLHKSVFVKLCTVFDTYLKRAHKISLEEVPQLVNRLLGHNKAIEYELYQQNVSNSAKKH